MSALDFRKIEHVRCAGIAIATFLSDDRQTIMVSASDLAENLSLRADLDSIDTYTAYDKLGRSEVHHAIPHTDLNHFLWMHTCKTPYEEDLDEFRRFFSYEVMAFWQRFSYAAASLSAREAIDVVERKVVERIESLDIPFRRPFELAFRSLGYDHPPELTNTSTEELAFMTQAVLLYASVAGAEQENGQSVGESMKVAERSLEAPLRELGNLARGANGYD